MSKKSKLVAVAIVVFFGGGFVYNRIVSRNEPPSEQQKASSAQQTANSLNKNLYPTDKPGSIWMVVNKKHPLPSDYAPDDLILPNVPRRSDNEESKVSKRVAPALEKMVADAKKAHLSLMLVSGYRSYNLQATVYGGYVKTMGQTEANKISAKPGTSEHQTGLAFDVGGTNGTCQLETCFGATPEGKWVAANAYKYGFIIRYAKGKESLTGYSYEPWHLRYVGKELAKQLTQTNQTMEEFFTL